MTREGIVKEISDGRALVCTIDTGQCNTCEAKHACMSLSGGGHGEQSFWLENQIGATPGDRVRMELRSFASLTIIVSTFLVPVLMLLAGYLLAVDRGDGARAVSAGIGLLAGVIIALIVNRKMVARKSFNMQIVRILERADGSSVFENRPDHSMEG
jgi:positive regulator of sigma E activity